MAYTDFHIGRLLEELSKRIGDVRGGRGVFQRHAPHRLISGQRRAARAAQLSAVLRDALGVRAAKLDAGHL